MPMLPEAPLRFSMMILPPRCAPSGSAMRRAMMSTLPPGGNGAMRRIGWLGNGCPAAGSASVSPSAQNRSFFIFVAFMIAARFHEEEPGLKAPSFAYAKPRSAAEAFDLLERPGARILAGGQSLIPSLNIRLSAPELLVDITGLPGLSKIEARDGVVRIGALCTHSQLEKAELPLISEAAAHIAHPAIRNRGTLGGSLALADPAAELPACAVALDAVLVISGRNGERRMKATDFFKGLFETDLKPGEILAGAEFPKADKSAFLELTRRQGDYAIVGLAAVRKGAERRLVFFGIGGKPVLMKPGSLDQAKSSLPEPAADLYHSAATKAHLAKVLIERLWNKL